MVSIEHLRRVWHADRGRLLLRTPGPVPLGLAYVLLVETNPFPNLSLFYRTMLFEYPSVLSRFCLIYHKKKDLNDFGLKIRIFDISKIKIFEKNIFTGNCSCDLKISSVKIFLRFGTWISAGILLKIEMHWFERGRTLNLFCRVYNNHFFFMTFKKF